jgi:hypothetical protein
VSFTRYASPIVLLVLFWAVAVSGSRRIERLEATGGVPAHAAGAFREPLAFQQGRSGRYYVFDRRGHTVYGFDRRSDTTERLVQIGQEQGRIIQPGAFSLGPDDSFVVADAPREIERVQLFGPGGTLLGGFVLPAPARPRLVFEGLVLNGIGSLQYTGESVLINQPERSGLITEYSMAGHALRTFGLLRPTGHEKDADLHLAFNTGLPLADPTGGFFFVFQTAPPLFRKYDHHGRLMFERHIQGRELDDLLPSLPTAWPGRSQGADGELPLVPPVVRAAAVSPQGELWVSLTVPYTYVYDADGEKIRTVQFRGAGMLAPTSLAFSPGGALLVTPGLYEFEVARSTVGPP